MSSGDFAAAMGARAIFAPARRLLRYALNLYALDLMHRSLLRQSSPGLRRAGSRLRYMRGKDFGLLILTVELNAG